MTETTPAMPPVVTEAEWRAVHAPTWSRKRP